MKHLLHTAILTLSLFSISFFSNGQACVPNTDTVSGITPDTLDVAFVGIPYQQVIYFRLPHDTTVMYGPVLLYIVVDSLLIDSVQGMPSTFSYACNTSNCIVYGGSNGCVLISGTADTADLGIHPLQVFIRTFLSDSLGTPLGFLSDTIKSYFINVELATGIPAFVSGNNFSLGKIFPNPAMNEITIPFYLPASESVSISVLNFEGRECLKKSIAGKRGYNAETLNTSLLNEGSYFIRIESSGRSLFSKIQVMKN